MTTNENLAANATNASEEHNIKTWQLNKKNTFWIKAYSSNYT